MVDISKFQLYPNLDGGDPEETQFLLKLGVEASQFLPKVTGIPPAQKFYLGFGIGGVIGLFLAQLESAVADHPNETEVWVVVGDVPPACLGTEGLPDTASALTEYCNMMQDWADRVLAGKDLTSAYTVNTTPTPEHARMLTSRLETIRKDYVPLAKMGTVIP